MLSPSDTFPALTYDESTDDDHQCQRHSERHTDGFLQTCAISIALEILQSYTQPSISYYNIMMKEDFNTHKIPTGGENTSIV